LGFIEGAGWKLGCSGEEHYARRMVGKFRGNRSDDLNLSAHLGMQRQRFGNMDPETLVRIG